MQRVVHLPENRTATLGSYVAAWKTVLAAPEDSTFQNGFNWYPESRKEVLREFRRGYLRKSVQAVETFRMDVVSIGLLDKKKRAISRET